jgi:hypothetical protein
VCKLSFLRIRDDDSHLFFALSLLASHILSYHSTRAFRFVVNCRSVVQYFVNIFFPPKPFGNAATIALSRM